MQKIHNLFKIFFENKKLFWASLIIIVIAARSAVWFYPYDSDHWIFYYVGKAIAQGKLLYIDAWDHKPPLIFEFNALMHLLFGGNLVLHRIFLTALAILDIFLFYKLARIFAEGGTLCKGRTLVKESADKVAKVALILYVFWRNLAQFASSGNNTENIGLIFLLLMYLTFFKWTSAARHQTSDNKNFKFKISNFKYLFLSGICLSILFYLKPNFSLLSIPILVEILILSYRSFKKFISNYLIFGLPFLLQTAFWILYFKSQNALSDFWIASFAFSSRYAKSAWSGNVSPQSIFIFIIIPLFLPLAIFTIYYLKDFRQIKSNQFYRFLLLALFSSLFIGFGLGSFYPYYFLISMPIFMLIFAYPFCHPERLAAQGQARDPLLRSEVRSPKVNLRDSSARYSIGSVGMTTLLSAICYLMIVTLLGGMAVSFAMSEKQLLNSFKGPVKAELNEYQQIANYIKQNSNPDDKIEAYTYGAVLYRMAERDAGSRFISASVLLLDTRDNYGFNLDDTFINDMNKSKAKYWIIAKDENSLYYQNKKIILYMLNNYRVEKEFDNYMVLKRK